MLPQPLIGFSSKAYQSMSDARTWAQEVVAGLAEREDEGIGAYVCVPYPVLPLMIEWLKATKMDVGVQDVSQFEPGPHTGDVPAELLAEIGCKYVMIGHPERRRDNGETYEIIARKVGRAAEAGLVPILIVGEDDPNSDIELRFRSQIEDSLKYLADDADVVLAYEPSWAIGQANAAPGEHIARSVEILNSLMADRAESRIVYGGSAKPGTYKSIVDAAADLVAGKPDGVFLGRAGLKAQTFLETIDEVRGC